MMYAIQCIRSTVRLVPIKLNGSYPLPTIHMLDQYQRMSSTHTHKQLVRSTEHSKPQQKQQQQQKQTQSKHEQQFALNHNHVSIFLGIRMK